MEDREREEAYMKIWQNVFRVTQQENNQCDIETEREVEAFLNTNAHYINACEHSYLNRLQGENQIDSLITYQEIEITIKSFRNITPGETAINKIVLLNRP